MMMNFTRFFFAFNLLFLSACSYLEDLFPDKEKDYQYTTEIPLLNWPSDLRKNAAAGGNAAGESLSGGQQQTATSVPENNSVEEGAAATENTAAETNPPAPQSETAPPVTPTEIKTSEEDSRNTISSVEIIKYDDGESRLRLGTGAAKAWRAVSKALSHNSLEVTERNHDQGLITVQYDPDEKKAKDDSLLDEIKFFFHGIDTNEEEYRLKLEEHDGNTDLLVLNQEHLPILNSEAALRLLKLIADTIKTDQAERKAE